MMWYSLLDCFRLSNFMVLARLISVFLAVRAFLMISGFSDEILLSVAKSSKNSEIVREGKKEEVYLSGWLLKFQRQCAFCVLILIFHHRVNATIHWQYDSAYRIIPNPISGIMSSVDCPENVWPVCQGSNFGFILMQQPIQAQNSYSSSSYKHVCQILFTDKALPTTRSRNLKQNKAQRAQTESTCKGVN